MGEIGDMRVLLVQPGLGKGFGLRQLSLVEPLGLETVGGALVGKHEVLLLDMRLEDDLSATLKQFNPDLCGISCSFTLDVSRALEIAIRIKAASEGRQPFVVVGGHHASLSPGDFNHPAVDAIVVGEGEATMAELARRLEEGGELRAVPGLVLNQEGGHVSTGTRPLTENLDDLPLPARHLAERYAGSYYAFGEKPMAMVETARGCENRCHFCSVWHFYRGRRRVKSPQRVVEEVLAVKAPYILFTDDNFLGDVERARQIAELLLERGVHFRCAIQARSDSIVEHTDVLKLWRQVGLVGVFVGVEKIDDAGLSQVRKGNSAANNERALEILHREGIGVTASFIVDPSWEHRDFAALRRYVAEKRIQTPSFTVLTPLPGTVLHRELGSQVNTHDCELFDLLHAVLPTRLSLAEFYRELAATYRSAYPWHRVLMEGLRSLPSRTDGAKPDLLHLWRLTQIYRTLTRAESFLAGHRETAAQIKASSRSS